MFHHSVTNYNHIVRLVIYRIKSTTSVHDLKSSKHFVSDKGPTEEHPYPTGFPYNNYKWPVQPRKSSHNIAKKRFHNSLNRSTDSDHYYLSTFESICPPPSSKKKQDMKLV
jgi:hypothetical protein